MSILNVIEGSSAARLCGLLCVVGLWSWSAFPTKADEPNLRLSDLVVLEWPRISFGSNDNLQTEISEQIDVPLTCTINQKGRFQDCDSAMPGLKQAYLKLARASAKLFVVETHDKAGQSIVGRKVDLSIRIG